MKKNKSSGTLIASGVLDALTGVGFLVFAVLFALTAFIGGLFGAVGDSIIDSVGNGNSSSLEHFFVIIIIVFAVLSLFCAICNFILSGFSFKYSVKNLNFVLERRGRLVFWGVIQAVLGAAMIIFFTAAIANGDPTTDTDPAMTALVCVAGLAVIASGILKIVSGAVLFKEKPEPEQSFNAGGQFYNKYPGSYQNANGQPPYTPNVNIQYPPQYGANGQQARPVYPNPQNRDASASKKPTEFYEQNNYTDNNAGNNPSADAAAMRNDDKTSYAPADFGEGLNTSEDFSNVNAFDDTDNI